MYGYFVCDGEKNTAGGDRKITIRGYTVFTEYTKLSNNHNENHVLMDEKILFPNPRNGFMPK